jgi:hypothetical protein
MRAVIVSLMETGSTSVAMTCRLRASPGPMVEQAPRGITVRFPLQGLDVRLGSLRVLRHYSQCAKPFGTEDAYASLTPALRSCSNNLVSRA